MEWQLIETAPQDGTKVLLFWPSLGWEQTLKSICAVGFYSSNNGVGLWCPRLGTFSSGGLYNHPPTHWMPLPDLPIGGLKARRYRLVNGKEEDFSKGDEFSFQGQGGILQCTDWNDEEIVSICKLEVGESCYVPDKGEDWTVVRLA